MARSVFIAIPAYTGMVHLKTMSSLIADARTLTERGDLITIRSEIGNPNLENVRALLVASFLATPCTDLIFADSDMTWEAGSFAKLLDAPTDFVGVAGPRREEPVSYAVRLLNGRTPQNGLLEVAAVGAAFVRLTRAMLERMVEHYSDTAFDYESAPNGVAWDLFQSFHEDRRKHNEDFAFCQRWRNIGGRVFIIPEIRMGHIGTKIFTGAFGDALSSTM